MNKQITIIDYGIGNLLSVIRAFEYCGATVKLAATPAEIQAADRLVLPGVGAFADGMQGLRERELIEPIQRYAQFGKPLLGICLGMQMLATSSEEFGRCAGLNLIPGVIKALPRIAVDGTALKSPHVGWSDLQCPTQTSWQDTILASTALGSSVYLVHSFAMLPDDARSILAYYFYGCHRISATVKYGAIYGCQFHPEKSGKNGLRVIQGFLSC